MVTAAIHGFILAFPLILPLGAQNIFVFNQGATQPKLSKALPVVLTAALCDTLLISLAVTGVSLVVLGSPILKTLLLTLGVIFLLSMGWVTWRTKPNQQASLEPALTPKAQIIFALSVSLLNPHAIMDTIGVIGTSSLRYQGSEKLAFALATISVSWVWFLALAVIGRLVGSLDQTGRLILLLNKISAVIMWGAATYLAFSI